MQINTWTRLDNQVVFDVSRSMTIIGNDRNRSEYGSEYNNGVHVDAHSNNKMTSTTTTKATTTTRTMMQQRKNARRVLYPAKGAWGWATLRRQRGAYRPTRTVSPSATLCLSHRSYVPTVRAHSSDTITGHPPLCSSFLFVSFFLLFIPFHLRSSLFLPDSIIVCTLTLLSFTFAFTPIFLSLTISCSIFRPYSFVFLCRSTLPFSFLFFNQSSFWCFIFLRWSHLLSSFHFPVSFLSFLFHTPFYVFSFSTATFLPLYRLCSPLSRVLYLRYLIIVMYSSFFVQIFDVLSLCHLKRLRDSYDT